MNYIVVTNSIDVAPEFASTIPSLRTHLKEFGFVLAFCAMMGSPPVASRSSTPEFQQSSFVSQFQGVDGQHNSTAALPAARVTADDGFTPPSNRTRALAQGLIGRLPPSCAPPSVSASADGEIGFSWVRGHDRLEAILDEDDHLAWVTKEAGKFKLGGDLIIADVTDFDAFFDATRSFHG